MNASRTNISLENTETYSNHEFLREQLKKCLGGHAKKYAANKKAEQLYKVSTPCLDCRQLKKEGLETVGELSKVGSQIVLKRLFWTLSSFDFLHSSHE